MNILRPAGNNKNAKYVVDELKFENGKLKWTDKKVSKREWETQL